MFIRRLHRVSRVSLTAFLHFRTITGLDVREDLEQLDPQVASANFFASLLRKCGEAKAFAHGKQVHACMIRHGYDRDTFMGNLIVQMYGNCGSVEDAYAAFERIREQNMFSWKLMLSAYAQNGYVQEAKRLFDKMPDQDVVSRTAMISAYALKGDLSEARRMFDNMPLRDLVSWNAMIAAYAQNGHSYEALQLRKAMLLEGVHPNKVTFISILDGLTDLKEGEEIHSNIAETSFQFDVVVGTALVTMYGKCGNVTDAKNGFDIMPERNLVSWNAMVRAYAQNGHLQDARTTFDQMLQRDVVSWTAILTAYAQYGYLVEAKRVFDRMPEWNVVSWNATIVACAIEGHLQDARSMFIGIPERERDVISWNSMITAYTQNGHGSQAIELLKLMDLEGLPPNKVTFIGLVGACDNLADGQLIHHTVMHSGYNSDVELTSLLVDMYGKCGSVEDARNTFNRMPQLNVVLCTAMIGAYVQNDFNKEALELFQRMDLEGVNPDMISFVSALDACANLSTLQQGRIMHADISNRGCQLDVAVGTALVNMYGKCGSLEEAKEVFATMPEMNVVSWTAMVGAYAQNGHSREAIAAFKLMDLEGMNPDGVALACIFDVCGAFTALADGKSIYASMSLSGSKLDVHVGTAVINMFGKCGNLENAEAVFNSLHGWNLVLCTAMVAAYARNGHGLEALELFQAMELQGLQPDDIAFSTILAACSHAGLLDDGHHYFVSITGDHAVVPTMYHYACMVDLLARVGRLKESEDLLNNMPFEPDSVAWMALLSSCNVHGNVKVGTRVAEHVFGMEGGASSVPYVILSNLYATSFKVSRRRDFLGASEE